MSHRFEFCVLGDHPRLDSFLSTLFDSYTRTFLKHLIVEREGVAIDGKVCTSPSKNIKHGSTITITIEETPIFNFLEDKEGLPVLDILYENDNVICINKQKEVLVHPPLHDDDSVPSIVHALIQKEDTNLSIKGSRRPGIVHRLDKDTTGALLLAKNDRSAAYYMQAFKDRNVHKEYIALLHHHIEPHHAFIEAPIGRSRRDPTKMSVIEGGKEAKTEYTVLAQNKDFSLVHVILHTGRTHQIRVHFSSIGYPVVGDTSYSNIKSPFPEYTKGQFLHAYKLCFPLLETDKKHCVTAPLPEDFQAVLNALDFTYTIS